MACWAVDKVVEMSRDAVIGTEAPIRAMSTLAAVGDRVCEIGWRRARRRRQVSCNPSDILRGSGSALVLEDRVLPTRLGFCPARYADSCALRRTIRIWTTGCKNSVFFFWYTIGGHS